MQVSKKGIIEATAALTPFAVAQFGSSNLVWPAAGIAVAGVYIYNRATSPGYAPFAPGHRLPCSDSMVTAFAASVYLAKQNPKHALIAGAAFVAVAAFADNYFYAQE
jgi:hypothetical protein